jgi:hypothetical protein
MIIWLYRPHVIRSLKSIASGYILVDSNEKSIYISLHFLVKLFQNVIVR